MGRLTEILNRITEQIQWPKQSLVNLVALLAKNVESDRPITLTTFLYRLYNKLESKSVGEWESKKSGHWDAAVRGSSCLRAAIAAEMGAELAGDLGISMVELVLDFEKFYDNIRPKYIAKMGVALGYPTIPMALGLMMHQATRYLTTQMGVSEAAVPTQSIIAGCGQAVAFTRLFLYDVLEEAHVVTPTVALRTWIDDIRARFWASRGSLRKEVPKFVQ
eukprot:9004269-Karenia_brevis.AAC.1